MIQIDDLKKLYQKEVLNFLYQKFEQLYIVAGTVASHNRPNEVPNNIADKFEAGKKINNIKVIPLKKYKPLKRIFYYIYP